MKSDIPHMTETDRTLRDPAGYVVSVGSAHQAQDVQVSHRPHRLQGRSPSLWCLEIETFSTLSMVPIPHSQQLLVNKASMGRGAVGVL